MPRGIQYCIKYTRNIDFWDTEQSFHKMENKINH